jgi:hypothetical protein
VAWIAIEDVQSMTLVLFHRTYRDVAEVILRNGFRDGGGQYMTDREYRGVWLSDVPWEGIAADDNDALLRVTLDCEEDDLAPFEWANDPPIGCREWLFPSAFIKRRGRIELLSMDAWDSLLDAV